MWFILPLCYSYVYEGLAWVDYIKVNRFMNSQLFERNMIICIHEARNGEKTTGKGFVSADGNHIKFEWKLVQSSDFLFAFVLLN